MALFGLGIKFLVMSAHRGKVFDERLPSMKWITLHCCYIIGHETMQCIDSCQAVTSAIGRYCCKSRKSNDAENRAKVDFWTLLLPQGFPGAIRRPVVVLV